MMIERVFTYGTASYGNNPQNVLFVWQPKFGYIWTNCNIPNKDIFGTKYNVASRFTELYIKEVERYFLKLIFLNLFILPSIFTTEYYESTPRTILSLSWVSFIIQYSLTIFFYESCILAPSINRYYITAKQLFLGSFY